MLHDEEKVGWKGRMTIVGISCCWRN